MWSKRRKVIDQRQVQKKAKPYGLAHAGAVAYNAGLTPVNCPYVLNTPEWEAWYTGWVWEFEKRQEAKTLPYVMFGPSTYEERHR